MRRPRLRRALNNRGLYLRAVDDLVLMGRGTEKIDGAAFTEDTTAAKPPTKCRVFKNLRVQSHKYKVTPDSCPDRAGRVA